MPAAAQISIYPLRQPRLSPAIDQALEVFQKHGLDVTPGTMSSVILGDDDALFAALKEAYQNVSQQGEVVMVVTLSNACPVPEA
jgi:uncharacterized protein YqgV (UPF0045/DUF77 family)